MISSNEVFSVLARLAGLVAPLEGEAGAARTQAAGVEQSELAFPLARSMADLGRAPLLAEIDASVEESLQPGGSLVGLKPPLAPSAIARGLSQLVGPGSNRLVGGTSGSSIRAPVGLEERASAPSLHAIPVLPPAQASDTRDEDKGQSRQPASIVEQGPGGAPYGGPELVIPMSFLADHAGSASDLILNAAMIPGWPPQRPYDEATCAVAPAQDPAHETMDDAQIAEYLAAIGADNILLEEVAALSPDRAKAGRLLRYLGLVVTLVMFLAESVLFEVEEFLQELANDRGPGEDIAPRSGRIVLSE